MTTKMTKSGKVDRRIQRRYPIYSDALKRRIMRDYYNGVPVAELASKLGTRPDNIRKYVWKWVRQLPLEYQRVG